MVLLLGNHLREAVPAMSDDWCDVTVTAFDDEGDHLCGGKRKREEHERVSRTGM